MWRDLAIGLSTANLCYLRIWSELLTYQRENTFWMKHPPTPTELAAVTLNVCLLGSLLGLGRFWARRHAGDRLAAWLSRGFLLLLLIPLNALRSLLTMHVPRLYFLGSPLFEALGYKGVLLLGFLLGTTGLLALLLWHRALTRIASAGLLAFFTFVPVTFGQALWAAVKYNPAAFADKPLAPGLPARNAIGVEGRAAAPRVLWMIFDEMDYRLALLDRPAGLELPELDRLRREALDASRAYPPGQETSVSLPAFITGRTVTVARALGPDELALTFEGSTQPVSWSSQPNIFSRARKARYNTALVGWMHPYCRVLHADLTACEWWPMAMQYNSIGNSLAEILPGQARSLLETHLFSVFGQSLTIREHVRSYQAILARATQFAVNRELGLVVLHFPVPHPPHAYDRSTGRFTLANSPFSGYYDSLALVDRTLGELRRAMEEAGAWETTSVLLTSDHAYRGASQLDGKQDSRIPFMLKLAGHNEGVTHQGAFNAVLSHDLLLAILHGEVETPQAAAQWLDRRRRRASVP